MSVRKIASLCILLCSVMFPVSIVAAEISQQCLAGFNGRNVRFVVSKAAGGGHDQYARIVARIFSDLTGARTQVSNIIGGHGLLGVKAVAAGGDEAITIGLFESDRLIHPFDTTTDLNLNQFHTLGIIVIEPEAWVAKTDFELLDFVGSTLVAAITDNYPATTRLGLSADAMGISIKAVSGYSGSGDAMAAILRGEVDVAAHSITSVLRASAGGQLKPVLLLADEADENLPDVPYFAGPGGVVDYLTREFDTRARAEAMDLARISVGLTDSVRALFISRNVSSALLRCTEGLVEQVLFSEEFARAAAEGGRPITPINARDASARLQDSFEVTTENRLLLSSLLREMMQ